MAEEKWAEPQTESEKQKYYYTIHCVHTIVWMQSTRAHIQQSTQTVVLNSKGAHQMRAHTRPHCLTCYSVNSVQ